VPGTIAPDRVLRGRYRLVRELTEGEWTTVWEARDTVLDRPVAVQVLHPDLGRHPAVVDRFHRDAIAAGALTHPNLVATYDTGSEDGVDYVVTELVTGEPLEDMLDRRRRLATGEAVAIAEQIADGLAAAHARGAAHRGLDAASVLIRADGWVKLTGFGPAADGDQTADVAAARGLLGQLLGATRKPSPAAFHALPSAPITTAAELAAALRAADDERTDRTPIAGGPTVDAPTAGVEVRTVRRRGLRRALLATGFAGAVGIGALAIAAFGPRHFPSLSHGSAGAGTVLQIVHARDYDPNGNQREHPETAARAIDGNPTTGWTTEHYRTRDLAFKGGVGLVLDLGRTATVRRVQLDSAGDWTGQIYASDTDGAALSDWDRPVGEISATAGTTTVVLDRATSARYVLVWVTRLPESMALQLDEVRVAG